MPPGRPQSICQGEIDQRLREIDQLNAEQQVEELESATPDAGNRRMPSFPGIGVSLLVITLGVAMGIYVLILAGSIGVLASLGNPTRMSQAKTPSVDTIGKPFQWRP